MALLGIRLHETNCAMKEIKFEGTCQLCGLVSLLVCSEKSYSHRTVSTTQNTIILTVDTLLYFNFSEKSLCKKILMHSFFHRDMLQKRSEEAMVQIFLIEKNS